MWNPQPNDHPLSHVRLHATPMLKKAATGGQEPADFRRQKQGVVLAAVSVVVAAGLIALALLLDVPREIFGGAIGLALWIGVASLFSP